jgi:hypothetical protein
MVDHMVGEILDEVQEYFKANDLDTALLKDFYGQLHDAVYNGVPRDITQAEFDKLKDMMRGRWMKILNIGF